MFYNKYPCHVAACTFIVSFYVDKHLNISSMLIYIQMIKKSRDPRWSEGFQFMLEEAPIGQKIHIEVMSKRRGFSFHGKVRKIPDHPFSI